MGNRNPRSDSEAVHRAGIDVDPHLRRPALNPRGAAVYRAGTLWAGGIIDPRSRTSALTHFPSGGMIIRSLFFASYRDMAGTDEMPVELPQGARVADLVGSLRARGGRLASLPESPVVAVNMDYAPLATELREGDEVAFIPPVAGG